MRTQSTKNPARRRGSLLAAFLLLLFGALCASAPAVHAQQRSTAGSTISATAYPLQLPAGLAYDTAGDLFVAEPSAHMVLEVTPAGVLSTFAGSNTQGYAGDGGPAVSALLDAPTGLAISPVGDLYIADGHAHVIRRVSAATGTISTVAGTGLPGQSPEGTAAVSALLNGPMALAFDAAGDLFVADSRNHRIARVDAGTGRLTTVAGNGTQGLAGDGGPALAASLDSPSGLALDAAGNLYLSDTHNQRVRRVDVVSHAITSVAGSGSAGAAGDAGPALAAQLHLPRGVTLDASGNLYVADSANHRVRRVDAVTGAITSVAGQGTQAFQGDGGTAVAASLDSPAAVVLAPGGLPTLADTANLRVRQVDAAGVIHTIAGLGATNNASLTLAGPSTVAYGSGTLTATLLSSPATGNVTFFDLSSGSPVTVGSGALSGDAAALSTGTLSAGVHALFATYAGDSTHSAAESPTFSLTVKPAVLSATPAQVTMLFGQAVPALTGSLTGLLPQDVSAVTLLLASAASPVAPPGAYPIMAAVTGPAAGNYSFTTAPAAVTVSRAPSTASLVASVTAGSYTAHIASTTSGTPGGTVRLLDGTTPLVAGSLSSTGDVLLTPPALALGSHTLSANYAGDTEFLPSASAPAVVAIGPSSPAPDFTLAATGQTSVSTMKGNSAAFSFAVTPVNGALASPLQLSASGLPSGATASFNPAYLPPGGTVSAFVLTVTTAKASLTDPFRSRVPLVFAAFLPLILVRRRLRLVHPRLRLVRRRRMRLLMLGMASMLMLFGATACGDRVNSAATGAAASNQTYTITVTGAATASSGSVLTHTATVTLVLQ